MKDFSSIIDNIVDDFSTPFVVINGTYGVGKTYCINQSIEKILHSEEPFFIFYFNPGQVEHLTQLPQTMKVFSNPKYNLTPNLKDLEYFLNRYWALLDELTGIEPGVADTFEEVYLLRSYFEGEYLGLSKLYELNNYKSKIDELIEKNSDKRTLLQLQNVIIESILASIVEVSRDLMLDNTKLRLYFFFDDFENYAYTIDEWIIKYWFNYLQNKTLLDFISYKVDFPLGNLSLGKLFDSKIVVASRFKFPTKRFQNAEPKDKLKVIDITPLEPSEISSYLKSKNESIDSDFVFQETFGIPFNLDLLVSQLNHEADRTIDKDYFQTIYNKIIEKYPSSLHRTIELLSCFDSFSEDAIRCLSENLDNYSQIFKYLIAEKELCEQVPSSNDMLRMRSHYKYYIQKHLSLNDTKNFKDFKVIADQYSSIYSALNEFTMAERKILRSLAYFNEFDFGEILQKSFAKDFAAVKEFVLEHPNLFEQKGKSFSLKEPLRSKLDELNKIVDNKRYKLKKDFLNQIVTEQRNQWLSEIDKLRSELDDLSKEILVLEAEASSKTADLKQIQQELIVAENDLIELRSKHLALGQKYTWKPFVALVFSAVLFFLLGNNIYNIFDETIGGSPLQGFAIAFKIFSVILIGLFFYLLIDTFGSKEKKQRFKIISQSIKEGEDRKYQLQLRMSQVGAEIKNFKERHNELSKTQKDCQNKLEEIEKNLGVYYLDTTE